MKTIFRKLTAALCAGAMLCTLSAINVSADEQTENITLPSGMTLKQVKRELEDYYREQSSFDDERLFASAALGIFQGDEVLYTGYFGEIDMENKIAADENSVYEWGSISKTFIWVSAMQLWEQGLLDLDRDVREYLPADFFQHLSYDEPITMLNLMNHNAGWQESSRPLWKTEKDEILSLKAELQALEPAQVNPPGEVVAYSNYGAAVAGYVIECITGQDYCEYVHEHIFEPLGMEHTALNPTHSDNAWVYENRPKTKSYAFTMLSDMDLGSCLNYVGVYPSGAAAGTLNDMMIYAQALVNDDAPLFENKETQELLFTATDCYGESDIPLCAHGFFCTEYAVRTYGHTGATTFGSANMVLDLDSKTGFVVMVNESGGNWYLLNTPTLVFGELTAEKYASGTASRTKLKGYYLPSRSQYRGLLKYTTYLQGQKLDRIGDAELIGNGTYQVRFDGNTALLLGEKTLSDGRAVIQQPSVDIMPDSLYLLKLWLLTLYVVVAVAAIFQLLIQGKLRKHGKWTVCKGSAVMTAGQIARIVSLIAWLGTFMCYANNQGGIPFTMGAVIGIVQMLVVVVCVISAVTSVISVFPNKKDKLLTVRYILNTIGCVLPVLAIVYFEMYWFWQI